MRLLTLILSWTMVITVIGAASLFSFTPFLAEEMSGNRRWWFIAILWAYGIYRSYRLYHLHKQLRSNE